MSSVLYFDIDESLLVWEDGASKPRPALAGGQLEKLLQGRSFSSLVCVSDWVDDLAAESPRSARHHVASQLAEMLAEIFRPAWLLPKLGLAFGNAHGRARHLDLKADWWYLDDLAELYVPEVHGRALFDAERGRRICVPDPAGDGADILEWIQSIPA